MTTNDEAQALDQIEMQRQADLAEARRSLAMWVGHASVPPRAGAAIAVILAELDRREQLDLEQLQRGPKMVEYMLGHLTDLTDVVGGYRQQLMGSGFSDEAAQAMALQMHSYMLMSGVYRPFGGPGQTPLEILAASVDENGTGEVHIVEPGFTATNGDDDEAGS